MRVSLDITMQCEFPISQFNSYNGINRLDKTQYGTIKQLISHANQTNNKWSIYRIIHITDFYRLIIFCEMCVNLLVAVITCPLMMLAYRNHRLNSSVCLSRRPVGVAATVMVPVKWNCCSVNPSVLNHSIDEWTLYDFVLNHWHYSLLHYDVVIGRPVYCLMPEPLAYVISNRLTLYCWSMSMALNYYVLDFVRSLLCTRCSGTGVVCK